MEAYKISLNHYLFLVYSVPCMIFLSMLYAPCKAQSTDELLKQRDYYNSLLEKLMTENEAANKQCQTKFDNAIAKYSAEELKTQKVKEIVWKLQDELSYCQEVNGETVVLSNV